MTTERHWYPFAGMHFYCFPRGERPKGGYENPILYRCAHVADFVVVGVVLSSADGLPHPHFGLVTFPIAHFDFYMADNLVEFLQSRGEKT